MKFKLLFLNLTVWVVLINTASHASTLFSISNGAWTSTIWSYTAGGASCGCTPSPSDNITISAGTSITSTPPLIGGTALTGSLTINGSVTATNAIQIASGATLTVNNTLNTPSLQINNGSTVTTSVTSNLTTNTLINNSTSLTAVNLNGFISVTVNYINTGYLAGTGFVVVPASSTIGSHSASLTISAPLPTTVTSFEFTTKETNTILYWETAAIKTNGYFEIERSFDGINFTSIKKVNAIYNQNNYKIEEPLFNKVVYYRLKQVDENNASQIYSTTIIVDTTTKDSLVSLYPNPSSGYFTIEGISHLPIAVLIYDSVGSEIYSQSNSNGAVCVDMSNEKKGLYFISILLNGKVITKRLIIE